MSRLGPTAGDCHFSSSTPAPRCCACARHGAMRQRPDPLLPPLRVKTRVHGVTGAARSRPQARLPPRDRAFRQARHDATDRSKSRGWPPLGELCTEQRQNSKLSPGPLDRSVGSAPES